jgi:hypothetical protein
LTSNIIYIIFAKNLNTMKAIQSFFFILFASWVMNKPTANTKFKLFCKQVKQYFKLCWKDVISGLILFALLMLIVYICCGLSKF